MLKRCLYAFILLFSLFLTACPADQSDSVSSDSQSQALRLGFIPSENMEEIQRHSQPLITMMSQKLGREVQPFIATDYTGIVEAFRAGKLDAAFLSPASYVMAHSEAGVRVILKAQRGEKSYYHSVIFTRQDANIHSLKELKGKTFAFGDTLSTAGYIYPLKMLKAQGLNPATDFDHLIFSGGHDATILAVLHKKVTAGATYANDAQGEDAAWKHLLKPEEAKQLKVLAVSEAIPSDNICISQRIDPGLAQKIQDFFVDLGKNPEGQKLIQQLYHIDRFVPATDADYTGIREAFSAAGIEINKELAAAQRKKP